MKQWRAVLILHAVTFSSIITIKDVTFLRSDCCFYSPINRLIDDRGWICSCSYVLLLVARGDSITVVVLVRTTFFGIRSSLVAVLWDLELALHLLLWRGGDASVCFQNYALSLCFCLLSAWLLSMYSVTITYYRTQKIKEFRLIDVAII